MGTKKHIEFTKLMEISLIVIFYSFYLFSIVVWVAQDRYIPEMLFYISRPFAIVTSGYMLKSAIENSNRIKKNYKANKKKKLSFSKIVTILIVLSFFVSTIFFVVAWYILDRFPVDLMEFIATPFITALPSYLVKTVAENRAIDNVIFAKVTDTINDIASSGITSTNIGEVTKNFLKKSKNNEED